MTQGTFKKGSGTLKVIGTICVYLMGAGSGFVVWALIDSIVTLNAVKGVHVALSTFAVIAIAVFCGLWVYRQWSNRNIKVLDDLVRGAARLITSQAFQSKPKDENGVLTNPIDKQNFQRSTKKAEEAVGGVLLSVSVMKSAAIAALLIGASAGLASFAVSIMQIERMDAQNKLFESQNRIAIRQANSSFLEMLDRKLSQIRDSDDYVKLNNSKQALQLSIISMAKKYNQDLAEVVNRGEEIKAMERKLGKKMEDAFRLLKFLEPTPFIGDGQEVRHELLEASIITDMAYDLNQVIGSKVPLNDIVFSLRPGDPNISFSRIYDSTIYVSSESAEFFESDLGFVTVAADNDIRLYLSSTYSNQLKIATEGRVTVQQKYSSANHLTVTEAKVLYLELDKHSRIYKLVTNRVPVVVEAGIYNVDMESEDTIFCYGNFDGLSRNKFSKKRFESDETTMRPVMFNVGFKEASEINWMKENHESFGLMYDSSTKLYSSFTQLSDDLWVYSNVPKDPANCSILVDRNRPRLVEAPKATVVQE